MSAVAVRERRKSRSVEIDPVVMHEVGILARLHTARAKPDLALLVVDVLHAPHHPVSFRDLVLHLAGNAVVEVQMVPSIALRHPHDFFPVMDVVTELLAGIAKERLRFLRDYRLRIARSSIYFDHAIHLMSALVVLECEDAAVLPPQGAR